MKLEIHNADGVYLGQQEEVVVDTLIEKGMISKKTNAAGKDCYSVTDYGLAAYMGRVH